MKSPKHRDSFREDPATNHPAEGMPSPDASANPFQRAPAPTVRMRVSQPWIQAVADWYGAMFRLAFGLGRVNSRRETGFGTTPPAPPLEQAESSPAAPPPSRPAAAPLRRKRKKTPSVANSRSRSSKASGVRRSRPAA